MCSGNPSWFYNTHIWSKWEVIAENTVISTITKGIIGLNYIQKRQCTLCGYMELDKKRISCV